MKLVGILLIVVGIAAGLYAGLWLAFIGGIVDVIEEVRAESLSALNIAIGVAKVIFAALIGWACALLFIIPGYALTQD